MAVNGLALSSIYVLVALGFTLLFGTMRVVNFAHGEFVMLGGFAMYYLYGQWGVPWLLALPAAAALVAGGAVLTLEWSVYRWFYQRMFQSMIGTMGLSMVLLYSSIIVWDAYDRDIVSPFQDVLEVGNVFLPLDRLVIFCVAVVVLTLFYLFMMHTRLGLAIRVTAVDLEIAEVQGIRTRTAYRIAFAIAIFMTALAGALYAQTYALSPLIGERPLMVSFIVVVLGGMGSILGATLGGVILGFLESFLGTLYGASTASFVSFGIVLALLIWRPWGLLGRPEQ